MRQWANRRSLSVTRRMIFPHNTFRLPSTITRSMFQSVSNWFISIFVIRAAKSVERENFSVDLFFAFVDLGTVLLITWPLYSIQRCDSSLLQCCQSSIISKRHHLLVIPRTSFESEDSDHSRWNADGSALRSANSPQSRRTEFETGDGERGSKPSATDARLCLHRMFGVDREESEERLRHGRSRRHGISRCQCPFPFGIDLDFTFDRTAKSIDK